jgi:putative ABC transport system permease protein
MLTLASIVLGVALVVAVSVSTATTRRAYYEMFSTVTGKTAVEVVATGGGTFPAEALAAVEQVPGVHAASPMLQRPTILYHEAIPKGRIKLLVLGVDPERDSAIRKYAMKEGRMFAADEAGMVLDSQFARSLKLNLGDTVKILTSDRRPHDLTLVGLLDSQGVESLRMAGVVFMPLARAQSWFRLRGEVESIQIVLDEAANEALVLDQLAAAVPADLTVRRPSIRTQVMDEVMNPSQQALRFITVFTVLLATFIILNTFLMSIGERRSQLAIMRCVGATRAQISRMIVLESLVLGVVGTLIGIGLGLLGALGGRVALGNLMQVPPAPLKIDWQPFLMAFAMGPTVALLGAVAPAWLAARYSPLEGLRPISRVDRKGVPIGFSIAGVLLVAGSLAVVGACLYGQLPVELSLFAAVTLMIGFLLLSPEVLTALAEVFSWALVPLLGAKARLAHRQVLRHRVRSVLTMGVLLVASSAGLAIANTILDSADDVRHWYERTMVGDFFIRATMPDMTGGPSPNIPEEMGDDLRKVPGIVRLDTAKFIQANVADQQAVIIVRDFKRDQTLHIDVQGAPRDQVRDELFDGSVILGTVLAQKLEVDVDDRVAIETRHGPKDFRIAALSNDYLLGGMVLYMERGTAVQAFDVDGVDAYIVKADPERLAEIEAQLEPICEEYGVVLHSFADIGRVVDGMIRGANVFLWVMISISYLVAAIGVVNTLSMNVLEQTRELGLLRIIAMTRSQVRTTIYTQAGLMGLIGLLPGTLLGLAIAYVMHLLMMQSIGRPVPFVFRPDLYLMTFLGGLTIVMLSASLPAERAVRLQLTKALQYE